jgi:hypothetical protein
VSCRTVTKGTGNDHVWPQEEGPGKAFSHTEDCRIQAADPTVSIGWSELERGHWQAVCVCGTENYYEPIVDHRRRLDPLDPSTAMHAGECEFRDADRVVLRVALKVVDGAGGNY